MRARAVSALDRRPRGSYKETMHQHHRSSLRRRFARLPLPGKAAVIVLAAGGVLRLLQVWAWRALDGHGPVAVALAARRLAHGLGYSLLGPPPWRMGTPETALGGMLFTAFGETGFALGLATALFSFAALWALWRWARSAAGETGGLLAVLAALFGPPGFFAAQAAPLGGWMAALAFECLLLAQAARMACDIRDRWEPSASSYAGLGVLAGLGIWTTRLLLPSVLVALWVLGRAMQGRWKKHWLGTLAMAAGSVPGLAAWLFGLLQAGLSPAGGTSAVRQAFWQRLASVASGCFRFGGTPVPQAMVFLLLLLALAGFCWTLAAARRRHAGGHRGHNPSRSSAAALAILYPVWLALSGGTASGDGRAWILWMPPLAILSAVACTVPRKRPLRVASLVLLALAVAWQGVLGAISFRARASLSSRLSSEHRAVAAALADRGATALLATVRDYPLNLLLRETVAVTDGSPACDPVILRKAELSRNPVWDADFPGLRDWLLTTGARADSFAAAGRTFLANLQAPIPPLREWPKAPCRVPAATPLPATVLADGRLDTWLESHDGTLSLVWNFPGAATPAALRFLFDDRGDPARFAAVGTVGIEYLRDGAWSAPVDLPLSALETSLGRPYPRSPLSFRILPLPIPCQPSDALRATLRTAPGSAPGTLPWRLAEASLFTAPPPGDAAAAADRIPSLVGDAMLGDLRARFSALPSGTPVFAPRRLSGRLAATGALPPQRLGGLSDPAAGAAGASFSDTPLPALVPDDRTVCLCVETSLADAARLALGAADRPAEADVCGPWTLFVLPPPDLEKRLPGSRLRWAGDLPVADLDFHAVDRLTDIILGKLQGQKTRRNERLEAQYEADPVSAASPGSGFSGIASPAIRWREEPGQALPDTTPADAAMPESPALDPAEEAKTLRFIRQLSLVRPESLAVLPEEIVYQAGGADLLDLRARAGVRPGHPFETVFRDGLALQGIDVSPSSPSPGSSVFLTLYWQASGIPLAVPETTFLQLCLPGGRVVASAEWTGPANAPGYSDFAIPLRECQTETISLSLPPDFPSAPLQIRVGRLRSGRPVPVKSTRGTLSPDASAAILDGLLSFP